MRDRQVMAGRPSSRSKLERVLQTLSAVLRIWLANDGGRLKLTSAPFLTTVVDVKNCGPMSGVMMTSARTAASVLLMK
jgi:Fe-S cluster biogenesis protein NfuA